MSMDPGFVAYAAYFTYAEGKSLVSGAPLPQWGDLGQDVRAAWRAAADGVLTMHNMEFHRPTGSDE
jgi:hypothetical protein